MRILTDIPDDDIERLDALAAREKCSRAAVIRDAVRLYLGHKGNDRGWINRGAGFWQAGDVGDAVAFQRGFRQHRAHDRA